MARVIKKFIWIIVALLSTTANAELLVYKTVDREDDVVIHGTSNGLTYFENVGARLDSGEDIELRPPVLGTEIRLGRGSNLRADSPMSFDVDGDFSAIRLLSFQGPQRIMSFSFNILTYANEERTALDLDGMIDLTINGKRILWGDSIIAYRVFQTDPADPIRTVLFEGSGLGNRLSFFDLYFTTGEPKTMPEPASFAMLALGLCFVIPRRTQ